MILRLRAPTSTGWFTPTWITANSSPPSRATVSVGRTQDFSRIAKLLQQQIASAVTQSVVNLFEVVKVKTQDSDT